jgi:hypothetical protein
MSQRGFFGKLLDNVPGYGGYRDKERRRDSDRAIRNTLETEYGQLAQRLGRIATQLAEERKIAAIGIVDKPLTRLTSFIDRVRTASYGYAPLFARDEVDEAALNQVAQFDLALADEQQTLAEQITRLEGADPGSPDFKQVAAEITSTVDRLHERFDKRHDVIHSAKALPEQDVAALLSLRQAQGTPRAYRLHQNEAISYDGGNYSVTGRIAVETPGGSWRAFQLQGGTGDRWLLVAAQPGQPYGWLRRADLPMPAGGPNVEFNGATYNLIADLTGTGEVIGPQGSSEGQPARYLHYQAAQGGELHVFQLGTSPVVLAGTTVDPRDVEVFSREM